MGLHYKDVWASCLETLQTELSPQQYQTWIKPLTIAEHGEANDNAQRSDLILYAPNLFISKWVHDKYLKRITKVATDCAGSEALTIQIKVDPQTPETHVGTVTTSSEHTNQTFTVSPVTLKDTKAEQELEQSLPHKKYQGLMPGYTFDKLITGHANEMARAAANQVAANPGTAYNPLFIYGASGLGKTHLLHAIGNTLLKQYPKELICCVHASDYYREIVHAYQTQSIEAMKAKYNHFEVLLLDDAQFLSNKTRTQEEFFHIFNRMMDFKKQMVLTSDTFPNNLEGVSERLKTRFSSGLIVLVEPPELEMREAILKKKASDIQLHMPDDVSFFMAKHLRSNVRQLEGGLKKITAYATLNRVNHIDLDLAKKALKDFVGNYNQQITIENIQKTVADYYKIKPADMLSNKRARVVARPRQIAMWICKEITAHSFPDIGKAFGNRDHTTVMYAVNKIEKLKQSDNQCNQDLLFLTQMLRG